MCKKDFIVKVHLKDYWEWRKGKLIQDAMPYVPRCQRELLISKTCDSCFKGLFNEPESDSK